MYTNRITPASIYRAVLLAFALVVAGIVFQQLKTLILGLLIVVIIALPLASVTDALQRLRIPRAIGALIGLLLLVGLLGGLIALLVPAFSRQVNAFSASLPHITEGLQKQIGQLTGKSATQIGTQLQTFIDGYTKHPSKLLGPLESVGTSVATVLGAIIVALLTALYMAIRPEPLISGSVRLFPPARRAQAIRVLSLLRTAYIGWLRGLIIGMVCLGGLTYIGLSIVGLGFAVGFAIFTAIAMIVPYFGALVSSIPPILYALALSPGKAVIVAIIYIAAHQLESNVIQPQVVARAVELHPAVVALGVLAVESLFGFVGLIVAVPILSTIKILVEELWISPNELSVAEHEQGGGTSSSATPLPRPPTAEEVLRAAEESDSPASTATSTAAARITR